MYGKNVMVLTALSLCLNAQPSFGQSAPIKIEKFNYAEWTKPLFSEAVTVTGIGSAKFIFLAGVGAEDENGPRGNVRYAGNFHEQCLYAYDKIKRVLAHHGATLNDAVKIVTYLTDQRYRVPMGKCIGQSFGKTKFPVHTLLGVEALAFPEMLIEVDVTAVISQ